MSQNKKRVVIKIGTAVITKNEKKARFSTPLASLVNEIALAQTKGVEIVLVSSGAIGSGMKKMSWLRRPNKIREKQAIAAVGQLSLMQTYEKLFKRYKVHVAQLLLTRSDFEDRQRYLNARATLLTLLEWGVIPIINENDTVAIEEIKFGDNDKLSALVAAKIDADFLVILTDVNGLYRLGVGEMLSIVPEITPEIEKLAKKESRSGMGTGGMFSKIEAAKIATASGITTIIANGFQQGVISNILEGKEIGTKFVAQKPLSAREKWILFGANPQGEILIDKGAVHALKDLNKSLLSAGVVKVGGSFPKGKTVSIKAIDGQEVARGIVSYSSEEIQKIKGKRGDEIQKILKRISASSEIVHRNSLVLVP